MATRTYRISLVGEDSATATALSTLNRLFEEAGLHLVQENLAAEGLQVQRLAADAQEVVLYVTTAPEADGPPAEAAPEWSEPLEHGGGGPMSGEKPPR